jgi:hypothetical protein
MKQIFLLWAMLCTCALFAQNEKKKISSYHAVTYSEVVRMDSVPSAQLYFNAKLFLTNAFHGARESAQIKDDKSKTVATKGSFPVVIQNGNGEDIRAKAIFTLLIQTRDGMYKYTLDDFYFAYTEETGITSYASFNDRLGVVMANGQWQEVEAQTDVFAKEFIATMKEHMSQQDILCKELSMANRKRKD